MTTDDAENANVFDGETLEQVKFSRPFATGL